MRRLVLLMGLFGCDEPARRAGPQDADIDRGGVDARRPDAGRDGVVVDGARPDARPDAARDVGVLEAGRPDAGPRDVGRPDAGPRDAQVVDAVVDAQIDAGPPAPCVGLVLPPPPDSPDGSEVCNYRDDDGDGLVDEGFPYEFIGEPVRITAEPEQSPDELQIAWSGDGYGVAWYSSPGFRFVKLGPSGCPVTPLHQVDQNPAMPFLPDSLDLAYSGDRFAVVFTQERRREPGSPGGFGTFVQLFDRAGQPVGALIDLDPTLSHLRFNAIVPFNDQFAVFSTAYHPQRGGLSYSAFAILDRDGRIVQGPSHPYDALPGRGQGMGTFIGLAYDGEGFGMAWHGVGNWFMRWSPAGEVLTPPAEPDEIGYYGRTSGIAWTGQHYVIPNDGLDNRHLGLGFVTPDLQQRFAVEVGDNDVGTQTLDIFSANGQLFHYGAFSGVFFSRLDPLGQPIAPRLRTEPERWVEGFSAVTGGPLATVSARDLDPEVNGELAIFFSRIGCQGE